MRTRLALCLLLSCLALEVQGADDAETALLLLKRAQKSLVEGEHEDALRRYQTIARLYPGTDWAATAWWQIARLENHLNDKQAAFDALQALVIGYAGHFEKAHAEQLGLARGMMDAEERRERRRGLEPARSKALNAAEQDMLAGMLQTIIRNGPHSDVAMQAHYEFALMLERAGKLPQALLMHEEFAEEHSGHELADDSSCQAAYIRYKQWKTMKSESPRQRDGARDAFNWFLRRYPQSERAALARACLAELLHSERKELESLARYYDGLGKPEAAMVYWRELALKFPELAAAGSPLREKIVEVLARPQPAPLGAGR